MKYLFSIILVMIVGCNIPKEKNITHDRYFFIVYDAMSQTNHSVGNFFVQSDTMPSMKQFKNDIYETYKCFYDFTLNQYIITNIIEFKDSSDYFRFKKDYNSPLGICDSLFYDSILIGSTGTLKFQ